MSGGGNADENGDDRHAFEQAMQGVEPLPDRSRRVPRRKPLAPRARPVTRRKAVRFEVQRIGERVEGHIAGLDRRRLRALQRGEVPVELRLDLHRLTTEQAREALMETLARAQREDRRCLLVIHGRGLSSPGEPVLKEAVPRWLTQPPAAPRVLAFTSAPPRMGGAGALLVLLRRPRKGRPGTS
jgi:DNA-nicking Smr family endonuclease